MGDGCGPRHGKGHGPDVAPGGAAHGGHPPAEGEAPPPAVVAALGENPRRFLAFL